MPKYGRRKSWVVISLLLAGLLTIYLSFLVTDQSRSKYCALIVGVCIFFISLEDISTDALAIKELHSASLPSLLVSIMQPVGSIFGSIFFLKAINP